ncbi:DUF6297 family protein [Actinomadura sp. B10D3]|uniref:DUF6297 family protein n=1 Tax=Actinomadura sp. B10D3 TaxID=3153557 RepID=UPI00325EE555
MTGVWAVRRYIRGRGRARASWTDRYTILAGTVMLAVPLWQLAQAAVSSLAREFEPSRAGAGLALVALTYAGLLALARTFGPVSVSAADAAWLVLSPLPRRGVLGRTASILLILALAGGAVLGVALLAALGAPDHAMPRLVIAVVLGACAVVGGTASAVLAQSSPVWDALTQALIAGAVSASVIAVALGNGPGRNLLAAVADAPVSLGAALAATCAAVTALLLRLAWGALGRIPARPLLDASRRTGHVAAAWVVLDPGALTWIAEDHHWRGRLLRSRPWPARPAAPAAVAWADWRRLARRPRRIGVLLASTALPALAAMAGIGTVPVAAAATGALAAAVSGTAGARRDADEAGLSRLLGVPFRATLAARALLPAVLGGTWLTLALAWPAVVGALPGAVSWGLGPAAAPALSAGALRMARRRPVDHSMPVIPTPAGPLPTGPFLWALTGIDVALLGCAPALLALDAPPSAAPAFLVAQVLAGTFSLVAFLATARR